jgi:glycosyltransferase involved in cell wall biosynthesis
MSELAVVIPAFKEQYLNQTLASLANQTNKNFVVYIGDDCSPYQLKPICDAYDHLLNIRYTRFDTNIGAKRLVNQWKRCIALSKGEPWLWLFSDDDIADKHCVENFYRVVEQSEKVLDVYRFNTSIIDAEGKLIGETPKGPHFETSEEMAYQLLLGNRGNSMPDHIFSREIYERSGGIVYTDFAQGADWASSILFSKHTGIGIIPEATVFWRYSGANISSTAHNHKSQVIAGHLQFIEWVTQHFKYLEHSPRPISYKMMLEAASKNLSTTLIGHYKGIPLQLLPRIAFFMRSRLKMSFASIISRIISIQEYTNPEFRRIIVTAQFLKKMITGKNKKVI